MKGKRVCRLHGGLSPGAPKGKANGNWKHGGETREAVALRRAATKLLREIRVHKPFNCDDDEKRFKERLGKLVKAKPEKPE